MSGSRYNLYEVEKREDAMQKIAERSAAKGEFKSQEDALLYVHLRLEEHYIPAWLVPEEGQSWEELHTKIHKHAEEATKASAWKAPNRWKDAG